MNKFTDLTKKLINMPLWSSEMTHIPRITTKEGLNNIFVEGERKDFKCVVSSVNKNVVDNINIMPTDLTFIVDFLTIPSPTKNDLFLFNNSTYKIIQIKPLGILNNEPVGYEFIIRLA